MLQDDLEEIMHLSGEERRQAITFLAGQADQLEGLISLLKHPLSRCYWEVALQVLQAIGYPANAKAVNIVLAFATESNAPGWAEAIHTLVEMDARDVIPLLVASLLDRTRHQYWAYEIEEVCQVLNIIDREYARACGPALAFLFSSQEEQLKDLDREAVITVLEKIGTECAAYALPALLDVLRSEEHSALRQRVESLLASFEPEQLALYACLLPK